MSKVIDSQLKKVQQADLSHYDESTHSYFIPRRRDIKIEEGSTYLIELNDTLLHPNSSLETLINNFNNGSMPTYKYYKIEVNTLISNMINFTGVAFDKDANKDLPSFWTGWVPLTEISVLQKL